MPRNVQAQEKLLSFYSEGKAVGNALVGKIFVDLTELPQTFSHLAWGNYIGFGGTQRFAVLTYDQRRIFFGLLTSALRYVA